MRTTPPFCLTLLIGALCCSSDGFSQTPERRSGFTFRPDAGYWIVEKCEAEFPGDGVIRGKQGNGWLRGAFEQSDFVLELDWKPERAGFYDAGVFFRAAAAPPGAAWPDFFQVNLKTGAEAVLKNTANESFGSPKTKPGDWNHLKLTAEGKSADCEVNGAVVWKTDRIAAASGYLALQVEEPKGGVILYRNVEITEIGHRSLLGQELDGWEAAEGKVSDCWKREGEEIVCTGAKGPWLRWKAPQKDFNLRLEYLLKEGGNSGVYIRVPENGAHHGAGAGIEVQILDDGSPRYAEIKPYQYCGSLYAIVPADPRSSRRAGAWNQLEIDCRGDRYGVWLNGVEVIRASGTSAPELGERRLEGYIGLQNHSEEVRFRNVRLGPPR